ncbi:MAG: hypothetical protein P1U37_00935 [Minwuia sp.]|nr:hypothetical protein [Minwuia sp.]
MRVNGVSTSAGPVLRAMSAGVAPTDRGSAADRPVAPTERISESRGQQDAPPNPLGPGNAAHSAPATSAHWPVPTLSGLIGHRLLFEVQRQAQLDGGAVTMADRASDAVIAYRAAGDLSAMVLRPDGAGLRQPFRI